ncbi:MAG: serine hydrolase domain-containing protein [Bacteroidota bacterium]
MRKLIFAFSIILSCSCLPAQTGNEDKKPDFKGLERRLTTLWQQDEFVGLEMYIEQGGNALYHHAIGWRDKERNEEAVPGGIYNIRSMTKPMAGALVQMYIDRGEINLEDKASQYLEVFNNPKTQHITIEDLLLHRAGYEQGQPGRPWMQYDNLQEMAKYWGKQGPSLPNDQRWSYADAHADIIGAILERHTSKKAGELLEAELLDKLNLKSTYAAKTTNAKLIQSTMPAYRGGRGNWACRWRAEDGPFYDFTMYAQSAFGTAKDYARFMRIYLNKGTMDGKRIISEEGVRRTFANRQPLEVPKSMFPLSEGKSVYYGHFWGFTAGEEDSPNDLPYLFMHQGSDGTSAYAFPDNDLIIIVLTQSRGMTVLPTIEKALKEYVLAAYE